MKLQGFVITLMLTLGSTLAFAQGGGGGGGGGGGAGSAGAGTGAASSGAASSAVGSPNAGSAGAGSLGTNGVPSGPANPAGLNNSGNDPSGSGNAPSFSRGTSTGLAKPPSEAPSNGQVRNPANAARGTNSAGTANSSGAGGALRQNGTRMPGSNSPTTTSTRDSDSKIDAENRKLDQTVKSICKGC
jgi:hypothetical protein